MPQIMLGGDNARELYTKGDLVIAMQYVNSEPAMVIFPRRKRGMCQGAFVVCLSAAYQYTDDVYLMAQAFKAAEVLGMYPDKSTVFRLADTIHEGLDRLCMMKPEPAQEKKVIGEGVVHTDGQRHSFEITH